MPVCRRSKCRLSWLLLWLSSALALLATVPAQAADFVITYADTRLVNHVYVVDADIDYELSNDALTALNSGVPLTIDLDITIEKVHHWWLNHTVAELEQHYQLQYHALSHQYLVSNINSGAHYAYSTLSSALTGLGTVRGLPLLDDTLLETDAQYEVTIEAELDIEALPSPLRPLAYLTSAWRLKSDEQRWSLTR